MAQAGLQAGLFRASGLFDASLAQLNGQGQELERSSQAYFAANARKGSVQNFLNQNAAPTPRMGRKLAGKCGTREARPPTKRQAIAIAEAPSAEEAKPEMPEDYATFSEAAERGNLVPMFRRIFSDQLTPVLAYKCLVRGDDKEAPSFLLESVEDGIRAGRYSFVGAHPSLEVVAKEELVTVLDHANGTRDEKISEDPLQIPVELSEDWRPATVDGLPNCFCGGWVGYTSYDTVRYVESKKLPFENAPDDDRGLADIHLGLYHDVVVFDHVTKSGYDYLAGIKR